MPQSLTTYNFQKSVLNPHLSSKTHLSASRYGFNGKMKDNEVEGEGDVYDYGARMYDARLGRWLAVDPLEKKYPFFSTYSFGANNPIFFIDPDGEKIEGVSINKNGDFVYTKAALKNGTDRYINARIQTTTGREKILALMERHETYKFIVTEKVFVLPTMDGKYAIAGGGANSATRTIVMALNPARFNTVTEDQLKDAVTQDKRGNLIPISIDKSKLDNPLVSSDNAYMQKYNKAYNESGAAEMDNNPETKIKTDEQKIYAFGAHEEEHLTKENIKLQHNNDVEGKEKAAYSTEIKERKEYLDQKNANPKNDDPKK